MFYPLESFDVNQKEIVTKYKLDELEQYHIKKYDTFKNGFNLTTGGEKCNMNPLSDEVKRKIGEKNRINMAVMKQLLTKNRDWDHEREWRIVVSTEANEFKVDLVSAIIVDRDMVETEKGKKQASDIWKG